MTHVCKHEIFPASDLDGISSTVHECKKMAVRGIIHWRKLMLFYLAPLKFSEMYEPLAGKYNLALSIDLYDLASEVLPKTN